MILCFHEIGYTKNPWVVHPGTFKEVVDEMMAASSEIPEIHFDDARSGVHMWALPYLTRFIKEKKIKAVIFPVINWLDEIDIPEHEKYSTFMSWRHLERCMDAGFEIGSHGMTHKNLIFESLQSRERELFSSKRRLEKDLGAIVDKFSYPYGAYDADLLVQAKQYYIHAFCLRTLGFGPMAANWEIPRKIVIEH